MPVAALQDVKSFSGRRDRLPGKSCVGIEAFKPSPFIEVDAWWTCMSGTDYGHIFAVPAFCLWDATSTMCSRMTDKTNGGCTAYSLQAIRIQFRYTLPDELHCCFWACIQLFTARNIWPS
ncbi:hypothetical protein CBOM_07658 [Ceraceosorus bombacis]|uniref:Uncharacterized protein n=1 Tax=Ceraceosorus bombacis TaxID=401625 RepID=A0A0P1BN60_9BASI|nr:hypothetical protein CBOM_07658 [Ceraceosorus bombacis]